MDTTTASLVRHAIGRALARRSVRPAVRRRRAVPSPPPLGRHRAPGSGWSVKVVPILAVVAMVAGFGLGTPLARAKFTGKTMNTGSTWVASGHFYYDTMAATTPAPWGYWHFDETSGTTATAAVGGRNGTFSTNWVTSNVAGATSDGRKAFRFANNGNSKVTIANSSSVAIGDTFSAEAWVRTTTTGSDRAVMGKGTGSFALEVDSANKIHLAKNSSGFLATSTVGWADNNWHHVVATKSGSTVKLYIDGADVTGTVTNLTMSDASAYPLEIGNDGNGQTPFVGDIDEPAFYTYALTAAQVQWHYSQR